MAKKILITGISGFVGGHLVDYLMNSRADVSIHGTIRERSDLKYLAPYGGRIGLHYCEMTDSSSVRDTLKNVQPDYLVHLAGQSSIAHSFGQPHSLLNENVVSTINLFEGIKDLGLTGARVLIIGSSDCYGRIDRDNVKIPEGYPLNPVSLYAITKAVNESYARHYHLVHGLDVVLVRTFNHTGPRRPSEYALSGFARQIIEIDKGLKGPTLSTGNLNVVRDFLDVRDVVAAYYLALEKCRSGEVYNICSGKGHKLIDLVEMLLSLSGVKAGIETDDKLVRSYDLPYIVGDNGKFVKETGWKTKYDIKDTLQGLLDYWRQELAKKPVN